MSTNHHTIIIGGGLAGLACATRLARDATGGMQLMEATDRVGGRMRTDQMDGFTLDHGFQVLLTAYPACRELLDYDALRLRRFEPGALIRQSGHFRLLGDPWRRPAQTLETALHSVGSLADKLRIAGLRRRSQRGSLDELYSRPQSTTFQRLQDDGFSPRMIDQFFRPFLGGVFLDESLACPSRMLEFVFRMFACGDVAIPADGMAAIPRQLADGLPQGSLRLQTVVTRIEIDCESGLNPIRVQLGCGEWLTAERVVIATESDAAARLLGDPQMATPWSGTTNVYYAADQPPDRRRLLMLRGDEAGVIQTAMILSNVAPEYAPAGKALVSVSVDVKDHDPELGDGDQLDEQIRGQLRSWFGNTVDRWQRLRTFRVPFGLPRLDLDPVVRSVEVTRLHGKAIPPGAIYVCGDHRETPSIQGALSSGLRVAAAIMVGQRGSGTGAEVRHQRDK